MLGKLSQIVTIGADVVVYNIQNHADTQLVGGIDEAAKVVRLAIDAVGREHIHAVIPPAEVAGEIGDGHDLERRHTQFRECGKFLRRGLPCPFLGERADVHFVNDLAGKAAPFPMLVLPLIGLGVHNLRRSMRTLRLEARSGIGKELLPAIQAKAIDVASLGPSHEAGKIAVAFRFQRSRLAPILAQDNFELLATRRPNAKVDAPFAGDLSADRIFAGNAHDGSRRRVQKLYQPAIGNRLAAGGGNWTLSQYMLFCIIEVASEGCGWVVRCYGWHAHGFAWAWDPRTFASYTPTQSRRVPPLKKSGSNSGPVPYESRHAEKEAE